VILVHGGAGPELTWERQHALADHYRLVVPWRRGFAPSPAAARQDFDRDAHDILDLVAEEGASHLVGFSYGGLGAAIAAGRRPEAVRSLTLIEPPFFALAMGHPEVRAFVDLSTAALAGGDPRSEKRFFAIAGLDTPETAGERERALELARGLRPPLEAAADWSAIAEGGLASLVVSGAHHEAVETVCDALATALGARRESLPGAGHAAQRTPAFNPLLREHLSSTDT
jgi:pimeloyl-ACP methyl ester carboxylesterase